MDIESTVLEQLANNLNHEQLPYKRLSFFDPEEYLPIVPPKMKLPSHITDKLDSGALTLYSLVPIAGKDSFLHCLLSCLSSQYRNTNDWPEKCKLLKEMREKLLHQLEVTRQSDKLVTQLDEQRTIDGINSHSMLTHEAKCFISHYLNINLFIIDSDRVAVFFQGLKLNPARATLIFFESGDGFYYICTYQQLEQTTESDIVEQKQNFVHRYSDEQNKLLRQLHKIVDSHHKYFKEPRITSKDGAGDKQTQIKRMVNKYKLVQLQELCQKHEINTKSNTGKSLRKADLAKKLVELEKKLLAL